MLELDDIFRILNLLLLVCEATQSTCRCIRPLLDQGQLRARHSELVCNHINGERDTEAVHEIDLSIIYPRIDQLIRNGLNIVLHALDALI